LIAEEYAYWKPTGVFGLVAFFVTARTPAEGLRFFTRRSFLSLAAGLVLDRIPGLVFFVTLTLDLSFARLFNLVEIRGLAFLPARNFPVGLVFFRSFGILVYFLSVR
jgi:hypothetical protein